MMRTPTVVKLSGFNNKETPKVIRPSGLLFYTNHLLGTSRLAVCPPPHSEVSNSGSSFLSGNHWLYVPPILRCPTAPSVETPQIQFSRNFVSGNIPHIEGVQPPRLVYVAKVPPFILPTKFFRNFFFKKISIHQIHDFPLKIFGGQHLIPYLCAKIFCIRLNFVQVSCP